jgi:hypothetical protein
MQGIQPFSGSAHGIIGIGLSPPPFRFLSFLLPPGFNPSVAGLTIPLVEALWI